MHIHMHTKDVQKFRKALTDRNLKARFAILRAVSGTGRLNIVALLHMQPEGMTVTDIARILRASTSRISHQMKILRKHGLVRALPNGREKIYVNDFEAARRLFAPTAGERKADGI